MIKNNLTEQKDSFFNIIKYAEKNGYKEHVGYFPIFLSPPADPNKPNYKEFLEKLARRIIWQYRYEIIFSHDFAKTFFGEVDEWYSAKCTCSGGIHPLMDMHTMDCAKVSCKRDWKFHLQQMVLQEDPFEYLQNFMEKNK